MFNLASSYIELEGFKLGSNSAASRTRRHPTAVVLTDKYIDTLLTKAADAFGTCITVAQYGKFDRTWLIQWTTPRKGKAGDPTYQAAEASRRCSMVMRCMTEVVKQS